jgi:hypothetical protein
MKIIQAAVALFGTLILMERVHSEEPAKDRTRQFRAISKLINRPRSVWWDAFGIPWEGRGTIDGWVHDPQVKLSKPIYEVWVKNNANEPIGVGITVFWNPSGMKNKAPTSYDIKKEIEDGNTNEEDYFDNRDRFNSRYNPLPAKLVFWVRSNTGDPLNSPITLSEAKELASYCGLEYDPDLKMFLDQSGKVTGKYYDDGGLEIDIQR